MSAGNYTIRIDQDLKEKAFPVIESYGLSAEQAVTLFLHQIADTHAIPLSFDHKQSHAPNSDTIKAIFEARKERKTAKRYKNSDDMMKDLMELVNE